MSTSMTDRMVLVMDNEDTIQAKSDEQILAWAVITQAFQDIELFLRMMWRKKVPDITGKRHKAEMYKVPTDTYRCSYNDATDAIHFFTAPYRLEDRNFWCEMIDVNPAMLENYCKKRYGKVFSPIMQINC